MQKVVIGLGTLAHSTLLLAVQSDGQKSGYFYALLAVFSILVLIILGRRQLLETCRRFSRGGQKIAPLKIVDSSSSSQLHADHIDIPADRDAEPHDPPHTDLHEPSHHSMIEVQKEEGEVAPDELTAVPPAVEEKDTAESSPPPPPAVIRLHMDPIDTAEAPAGTAIDVAPIASPTEAVVESENSIDLEGADDPPSEEATPLVVVEGDEAESAADPLVMESSKHTAEVTSCDNDVISEPGPIVMPDLEPAETATTSSTSPTNQVTLAELKKPLPAVMPSVVPRTVASDGTHTPSAVSVPRQVRQPVASFPLAPPRLLNLRAPLQAALRQQLLQDSVTWSPPDDARAQSQMAVPVPFGVGVGCGPPSPSLLARSPHSTPSRNQSAPLPLPTLELPGQHLSPDSESAEP